MCQHKVLAHTPYGYVIQCRDCNHFQIGFGTSVISYSTEEFEIFSNRAASQYELYKNEEFILPKYKKIMLPTFSQNVQLIMSFTELTQVRSLLEEAGVMLELEKILEA